MNTLKKGERVIMDYEPMQYPEANKSTAIIYTIQFEVGSTTDVEDFASEYEARERYAELIADTDTVHAWLFNGSGDDAECLEEFVYSDESKPIY
jgi:hypothetical protein